MRSSSLPLKRALAVTAFKDSPRTTILRFAAQRRMALIFFFLKNQTLRTDPYKPIFFILAEKTKILKEHVSN
jgi:hypothetical protein